MPQMSPHNWLLLYIMFNLIMILIIAHIYYFKYNMSPQNSPKLKKKPFTYKW